jgi:hypothetical protein
MPNAIPSSMLRRRDSASEAVANLKPTATAGTGEVDRLHEENATLRARIEQMEQLFADSSTEADLGWADRQREYEGLLEEKSEVIRSLHQKIAELREQAGAPQAAQPESNEETPDKAGLLLLKQQLEEERLRLVEDEESMMTQMRQLEMALAKDRAELARQKMDIQRLQNEFQVEMNAAQRDSGLRERLGAMQLRPGHGNGSRPAPSQPTAERASGPASGNSQSRSGIFRRIFGS